MLQTENTAANIIIISFIRTNYICYIAAMNGDALLSWKWRQIGMSTAPHAAIHCWQHAWTITSMVLLVNSPIKPNQPHHHQIDHTRWLLLISHPTKDSRLSWREHLVVSNLHKVACILTRVSIKTTNAEVQVRYPWIDYCILKLARYCPTRHACNWCTILKHKTSQTDHHST